MAGDVAELLKALVEDSLGTADVFVSRAIEGGARWTHEIPKNLENCGDGLVVVTSENVEAPWLHFEAGAISKQIDASYVTPLLFDADIGDLQGTPLSLFQAKRIAKNDLQVLMEEMGKRRGKDETGIRRRFGHAWTDFEAALSGVRKTAKKIKRRLNNDDLGAMIESLSAQVARLARPEESVAAAIYGQGELATASPKRAAELIYPHFQSVGRSSPAKFRNYLSNLSPEESAEVGNFLRAMLSDAYKKQSESDKKDEK